MTIAEALEFVHRHGVALESASGPVPSLAEAIAGGPIRGNWWRHAKSHEIFVLTRAVRDSPDVLVCRLVGQKISYVHRRLWLPAWVPREVAGQARLLDEQSALTELGGWHSAMEL